MADLPYTQWGKRLPQGVKPGAGLAVNLGNPHHGAALNKALDYAGQYGVSPQFQQAPKLSIVRVRRP